MKICMVTSSFPRYVGDVWGPWILEYCVQLTNLGFEIHVLCPMTNASGEKTFEMMRGVFVHRFSYWPFKKWQNFASPPGILPNLKKFKMTKFQTLPFLFRGWFVLFKLIKKYNIDLIFAQWIIPSGFWGVVVKKLLKKPVVISAQGAEFFIKNRLVQLFIRETMIRSDLILPVSYHMKKLGLSFRVNEDKFQIVPNAVNIEIFKRTRPHKAAGIFRILTVRRLVPEKRVEDLIEAFAGLKIDHKDVRLTIIGDGPEREKLEKLAKRLNCSNEIEFLGFVDNIDLPRYYNATDVYVLSSVQEGLSLTLLEAMACELPVVSTNIVGNPEVIVHKKNGYLVSPKNPGDIEKGITFFYENRRNLTLYGKASRRIIEEKYTSKKIACEILDIFRRIIKPSPS